MLIGFLRRTGDHSATASFDSGQERLTLKGVGPIRIGMTIQEANSATAGRLLATEPNNSGCYYVKPARGTEGLQFMVSHGRIARVDLSSPAYATRSGARVGQTQDRLKELYSGRLEVTPHKYVENGFNFTFIPEDTADQDYRMVFETDGKHVTGIKAGKLPEVEYVEGCS